MKKILFTIALLFPIMSFAQHHGHGHEGREGWHGGFRYIVPVYPPLTPYPYYYNPYPVYTPPPVYIERPPMNQPGIWYFCRSSEQYYPNVRMCPEGWVTIPAR